LSLKAIGQDFDCLKAAVRAAGEIALGYFGSAPAVCTKSDGTAVSEADIEVDAFLKDRLCAARPSYGWLSEESEDDKSRLSCRNVWIVDPIDGTRAFLKNRPYWSVSAALVRDGRPILAAVFNPAKDEFYDAQANFGARLNGRKIGVSAATLGAGCRIAGSRNAILRASWPEPILEAEFVSINSIAYRVCLTAAGTVDAVISLSNKSDWDLAAAHLITVEAGGNFTTHRGQTMVYNRAESRHESVIAAGPTLHKTLVEQGKTLSL